VWFTCRGGGGGSSVLAAAAAAASADAEGGCERREYVWIGELGEL